MRLGIDTTPIDDAPSGARGRLEGLVPALLAVDEGLEVTLYLPRASERPIVPAGPRVRHVRVGLRPGRPILRMLRGRFWPKRVRSDRVDVFLTDYHPVLESPPTLVTIHDLRSLHGFGSRSRGAYFRWRMPAVLRRAAGVVAPSETVGREIVRRLGVPADRIHVVPNAPPGGLSPDGPREDRGAPYVLHLGPDVPRKNLDALGLSPVPVVLAGRPPLRSRPPFVPLGLVDGDRRAALIRGAAAVVVPALCEGFGIPVVEAFAAGTPVIAARAGALPEVVGEAGILVDPDDPAAWRDAIARMIEDGDLARCQIRLGVESVADRDWAAAATVLAGAVREAARFRSVGP